MRQNITPHQCLLARITAQRMMLDLAGHQILRLHQELALARELLAHHEDPPPPRTH